MEDLEAEKRIIQYSTDSSPQPRPQGFSLKKWVGREKPWGRGCRSQSSSRNVRGGSRV